MQFAALVLVAATLLFAETSTFALAMSVLASAVGAVVGQTVAVVTGGSRVEGAPLAGVTTA